MCLHISFCETLSACSAHSLYYFPAYFFFFPFIFCLFNVNQASYGCRADGCNHVQESIRLSAKCLNIDANKWLISMWPEVEMWQILARNIRLLDRQTVCQLIHTWKKRFMHFFSYAKERKRDGERWRDEYKLEASHPKRQINWMQCLFKLWHCTIMCLRLRLHLRKYYRKKIKMNDDKKYNEILWYLCTVINHKNFYEWILILSSKFCWPFVDEHSNTAWINTKWVH